MREPSSRLLRRLTALAKAIHEQIERDERIDRESIMSRWLELCDGDMPMALFAAILLFCKTLAENDVVREAYEKKSELLESLLAAPQVVARVLKIIRDDSQNQQICWALVDRPVLQAVRIASDVDPDSLDPDLLGEDVWARIVKGDKDALVVIGRVVLDPAAIDRICGPAQEFTFLGFCGEEQPGERTRELTRE